MATTTSSKTAKTTKATKAPKIMNYSDYSGAAPSNGPAKTDSKGNLVAGQSFYKGGAPVPGLKINKSGQATDSEGNLSQDRMGAPASLAIPNTPIPEVAPIQQPEPPQPGAITPQQGLQNALASGKPAPQDGGEARSQIQQYLPQESNTFYKPQANSQQVYNAAGEALSYDQYIAQGGKADFSNVRPGLPQNAALQQQLESDPGYQQLLQAQKEYNDATNQRMSLTQEYDKLSKKLGIDSLNTELMNMKNVIEGTEDDLRTEITKAGGFATESQVQALTMARNKQLVKNYNNLLETKQMAMETLNTMIGLAAQDRQFAQQAALQKFQIETQIIEYQDRMKQNSQNTLFKLAETYGYGAIQSGDPWQDALTEKTLGLPSGGLAQLANMKTLEQQRFEQQYNRGVFESDRAFGLQQKQFNRGILESDRAYALQSRTLVENPDGSRSIVNLLDGSTRAVQGNDYWGLYGTITGPNGSSAWSPGLDVDLKIGDPVFAPSSGEVIFVGENGGFGNQVKIRTDSGEEVWLSHLNQGAVSVGDRVKAGDVVGIGGNTGNVIPGKGGDGSHLDFTVRNAQGQLMTTPQARAWASKVYGSQTYKPKTEPRLSGSELSSWQGTIDGAFEAGQGLGSVRSMIDRSNLDQQDKETLKEYAESIAPKSGGFWSDLLKSLTS